MAQPEDFEDIREIITAINALKPVQIIQGGETRQKSVYNGLQALPEGPRRF
jgi:2-C-methyl-D-erythritol 4-phosphate cytidylyltransferase